MIRKDIYIKIILILLVNIIPFSWIVFSIGAQESSKEKVYRVGISTHVMGNINENDISAALKAWAKTIIKEQNLDARVEVRLLSYNGEEIRNTFSMDIHKTPAGRQLLTVIQSSRMEKHPVSILDTTIDFLWKHEMLVKEPVFAESQ